MEFKNEELGKRITEKAKEVIKEYINDFEKDVFKERVDKEVKEILGSFIQMLYDEYKFRLKNLEEEVILKKEEVRSYEPPEKKIYFRQGILRSFEIFVSLLKELEKRFLK
jgi:hypothetical protein